MRDHSNSKRGFLEHRRAYWAAAMPLPPSVAAEVMFGLYTEGGGTTGEMAMRWHNLGGEPHPRLECFGDSWSALAAMRDVTDALAQYDVEGSIRTGLWPHRSMTPEVFCALLLTLGFEDRTPMVAPVAEAADG